MAERKLLRRFSCGCGKIVMRVSVNQYGAVCYECQKKREKLHRKEHWSKYLSLHTERRTKYMADRQKRLISNSERDRLDSLKDEVLDCYTFQRWHPNKISKFNMNDYVARVRL